MNQLLQAALPLRHTHLHRFCTRHGAGSLVKSRSMRNRIRFHPIPARAMRSQPDPFSSHPTPPHSILTSPSHTPSHLTVHPLRHVRSHHAKPHHTNSRRPILTPPNRLDCLTPTHPRSFWHQAAFLMACGILARMAETWIQYAYLDPYLQPDPTAAVNGTRARTQAQLPWSSFGPEANPRITRS